MTAFNFLKVPHYEFWRRVQHARIPRPLQPPFFAACTALVVVAIAFVVESHRLHEARALELRYSARYELSQAEARQIRAQITELGRLAQFAAQVREVQNSGNIQARQFAEIGDRLPAHVWLTAIKDDREGVSLSGRASSLTVLSAALRNLSRVPQRYVPRLVRASIDENPKRNGSIIYDLHLDRNS